jgi:putative FmdB family regulatory protein
VSRDNIVDMPIYEYRCESCGDKFEKLVRRAEDAMEAGCPACGEKHLHQEYSTFSARATSGTGGSSAPAFEGGGGCPAGMCGNPGMCGRN